MKLNSTNRVVVGTLALLVSCLSMPFAANAQTEDKPETQTEESSGSFVCAADDSGTPITVFKTGEENSAPLITWKSRFFGPQYKPEQRCNIVSEKLNSAAASAGGFENVYLTHGKIKRQTVICHVESKPGNCNAKNQLFTLPPELARNPQEVLEQMKQLIMGNAEVEPIPQTTPRKYINLGFVKRMSPR